MQFLKRVEELERAQLPYALATVVQRRAPVSAHLGDRALITADGVMEGFVGGSCSRDVVRRQGLDAIHTGIARLLQIRPDPIASPDDNAEMVVVPMGCASEGAVDVYIEPHLPARTLVIVGHTPVASALARLASSLDGYRVQRVVAGDELRDLSQDAAADAIEIESLAGYLAALGGQRERLVAVVASQGHYDERALATLLSGEPQAFVGLLASRKRAATVFGALEQEGIAPDRVAQVRNPVGLDLGARTAGEVAVSILAEIVGACVPSATIDRDGGHHCCH
ncbi:MAG TPA: XdhC/CoxI family protein [Candidatus Acidoferrum sp.]|nr:XdhC/CoxI family protein [Candidatus Acidoferrum sp.]